MERGKKRVVLKIELDEEEYRDLEAVARSMGYELPTHLIESLVRGMIRGQLRPGQAPAASMDAEQLARRLRRTIEDLLNPYTAKIDEIARKIGQLIELVEGLTEGQAPHAQAEAQPPARPARRESYAYEERSPRRRSAMDRLREEGILLSSEARWINDPERFFSSLERRGAKVLRLGRDKFVAVHPEFWERFVRVLSETAVRDNSEVESLLDSSMGPAAVKLFRLLVQEGLAYYDEDEAAWKIAA